MATEAGGWTKGKSREVVPGGACTKASLQVSRPSRLIKLPRVDLPLPAVSTTATRHSTQAPIPAHPPLLTSLNNHLPTRFRGSANDFVDYVVSSLILSPLHHHSLTKSQTIFILYYAYCWRTRERFGCLFQLAAQMRVAKLEENWIVCEI